MIFLFTLSLIILSQFVFFYGIFSFFPSFGFELALFQTLVFVVSIFFLFKNFRRKQTTNYRPAFNSFGVMIASGVPSLPFLPFGIAYFFVPEKMILTIGLVLSFCLFVGIIYGIIYGRWNWKIKRVQLNWNDLPESFKGKKIVQISDIHVGSFFDKHGRVEKAIDMINEQDADYVFFTGDLVNNLAAEMKGWEAVFSRIKAKKGKFSILGNHDYADYVPWDSESKKDTNFRELLEIHKEIGFTPLLNESVELEENVFLLGVENWGIKPFRQSGKLIETLEQVPSESFKILLSHDPSHFDEEVIGKPIHLTLSGHTHGMQFGIERFGIKWSPVSFRYKKWAGLYEANKQYLYVNRGFGYLGFPGRVGIYPEITVLEFGTK